MLVMADRTLCGLLAEALPRYTGAKTELYDSCAGIALSGRSAVPAVLLFDLPQHEGFLAAADGLFAAHSALAPFCFVTSEKEMPPAARLPARNIIACPLRIGVLLDRINRHLAGNGQALPEGGKLAIGPYFLLPEKNILRKADGTDIFLTEKERDILVYLYRQGGIVERQLLLDDIWGYAATVETHTLETHIYRLRQKIEDDPAKPRHLLTDGAGYRLVIA